MRFISLILAAVQDSLKAKNKSRLRATSEQKHNVERVCNLDSSLLTNLWLPSDPQSPIRSFLLCVYN
jgi:hypothetical protein